MDRIAPEPSFARDKQPTRDIPITESSLYDAPVVQLGPGVLYRKEAFPPSLGNYRIPVSAPIHRQIRVERSRQIAAPAAVNPLIKWNLMVDRSRGEEKLRPSDVIALHRGHLQMGRSAPARYNVTNKDIEKAYGNAFSQVSEKNKGKQEALEDNYLKRMVGCSAPPAHADTKALPVQKASFVNVSGDKMAEMLNNFYSANSMAAALCAMNSILYIKPYQLGKLNITDRIRLWLHRLSEISSGTQGQTAEVYFRRLADAFVLKAPITGEPNLLSHEIFVGIYATNRLRAYCPTFAYIFGGFKCSPPLFDKGEAVTWCTSTDRNGVTYAVYENIAPGETLRSYLATCSVNEFITVIQQILYALMIGQYHYDFTHYDLHDLNIIIRKPYGNNKFEIKFVLPTGIRYVRSNVVPVIIDYGFTHVTVDGQHFGHAGLQNYFIYDDRSSPLYDAYKLLMRSAKASEDKNIPVFEACRRLLPFFNRTDTLESVMKEQKDFFYSLPLYKSSPSLGQFIKFFQDTFAAELKDVVYVDSDSKIHHLYCDEVTICPSLQENLNSLGLTSTPQPKTYFDFYDAYYILTGENKQEEAKALKEYFLQIYDAATNELRFTMQERMRIVTDKINALKEIKIDLFEPPEIYRFQRHAPNYPSETNLEENKKLIVSLADIEDNFNTLRVMYMVIKEVNRICDKNMDVKMVENFIIQKQNDIYPYKILRNRQSKTMEALLRDRRTSKHFENNKTFAWYRNIGINFGFGIPS